ncbi:uncharacterized protein LOC141720744 isoform X2 [Apium graveolens]|uniref:uncharacterized protein LOC141720744 isoform X2 n=1 Tax=Apium graveolens TaxID=4045 RepID=UPI003D794BCB
MQGLSRAKNFTSNGHAQQLYELIIFRKNNIWKALLMDQKTIACDSRNFVSYKFAYIAPVMLLMQFFLAVVGACGSIWNVINTAPSISVCIYSSMFIWNASSSAFIQVCSRTCCRWIKKVLQVGPTTITVGIQR